MMIDRGIQFGDIHSYYDLGLVLSAVDIPAAKPKLNYIDIPGSDGSIDLTEVHGDVKYNDRDCKFKFTVPKSINDSEWEEIKTKVNNALNGKTFRITLDKDPDYYYSGRCSINEYAVNKRLRQITVDATVLPWKLKQSQTVITAEMSYTHQTIYLPNGRKPVYPTIESTGWFSINNDYIVAEEAGTYPPSSYEYALRLIEGMNEVVVVGEGEIKFIYQEGDL